MAEKKEDRDTLIAFIVGGAVLVLIFLYLFGGTHGNPAAATADGSAPPSVTTTPAPDGTVYTYNIAPYNPDPGLSYGASGNPVIYPGGGNGCCNSCGPSNGQQYQRPNVSQFMTLLGFGNAGGA